VVNLYRILSVAALTVHLVWILWVICGWLVTRNRPLLRWFHILSLIYSIVIEIGPWPCPLTMAEQWLQQGAGTRPYHEPFLVRYLEALVYPNVPQTVVTWCGVAVCLIILGVYAQRFRRRRIVGW